MSSSDIAKTAAEWLLCLNDSTLDTAEKERLQQDFLQWQQADERHARAVLRLQQMIRQLQDVREAVPDTRIARAALNAASDPDRKRRRLYQTGTALALLAMLLAPLWLSTQGISPGWLMADFRAGVGEWQHHTLPDGSEIILGSASAIDLDFSTRQRILRLKQGEVLIEVAADPLRPFIVETTDGSVRALGTRFVVEHTAKHSRVSMIESRVEVSTGGMPVRQQEIRAGQSLRFTTGALGTPETIDPDSMNDAWKLRQLVVDQRPLPEVLATLSRHHKGLLLFDAEALAGYQVSAVLPLTDPDLALNLLAESLSLHIRKVGPWIIRITP